MMLYDFCKLSSRQVLRKTRLLNHYRQSSSFRRAYNKTFPLKCTRYSAGLNYNIRNLHSSFSHFQNLSLNDIEQEYEFQADTKMLLDIVAKSLYSEKEVFIRELISNASDAIQKAHYMCLKGELSEVPEMRISLNTDKYSKTLTIEDTGIGMTKDELINNLGTIARSGSKEFLKALKDQNSASSQNIIGQFGVGFYSAFMVSDKVEVFTRSQLPGNPGLLWSSCGTGNFVVQEVENIKSGTKIICHLKTSEREFADDKSIKDIIKKYSNFVGCPIEVNSEVVNTIQPLWLKDNRDVTPQEHDEFYRFVGSTYDRPRFTLHFHTDAPINVRCILYFPEGKPGLFDLGRDTGDGSVSLYCHRVLIKNKAENILPKWLRFIKGIVDSEDIPLNLSRELLQNSPIINKLRTVIQNRIVRFLVTQAQKNPEDYKKFFQDYGIFLKEGIITSPEQFEKEEIAKLLHYESSSLAEGKMTTFAEYVSRMPIDQKDIYYLAAPSRTIAEISPYIEALKKQNVEILFCYESYDEVVLMQLRQFTGKNLVSVEKVMRKDSKEAEFNAESLSKKEAETLMDWMKTLLAGKCYGIKATPNLELHPCVVTVEEMGAARHFLRTQFTQMNQDARYSILQPRLDINLRLWFSLHLDNVVRIRVKSEKSSVGYFVHWLHNLSLKQTKIHPIIKKLNTLRDTNTKLAELVLKQVTDIVCNKHKYVMKIFLQIFDNAMVTAGLVEDPRTVLTCMNELLLLALEKH